MEQSFDLSPYAEAATQLLISYGLGLVGAIVTLVAGWMLARWARRMTLAAVNRVPWVDQTLRPLLASIAHYAVLVVTIIAILNQFGVQTGCKQGFFCSFCNNHFHHPNCSSNPIPSNFLPKSHSE